MASHARLVINELLAALRTDWGDFDLSTVSGTPKVVLGSAFIPPVSGSKVYLSAPERITDTYGRAPIGGIDESAAIPFVAWVESTSLDPAERTLDALDFAEEMRRVVVDAHGNPANPTLYGTLMSLLPVVDDVYGEAEGMPPAMACIVGAITYSRVTSDGL